MSRMRRQQTISSRNVGMPACYFFLAIWGDTPSHRELAAFSLETHENHGTRWDEVGRDGTRWDEGPCRTWYTFYDAPGRPRSPPAAPGRPRSFSGGIRSRLRYNLTRLTIFQADRDTRQPASVANHYFGDAGLSSKLWESRVESPEFQKIMSSIQVKHSKAELLDIASKAYFRWRQSLPPGETKEHLKAQRLSFIDTFVEEAYSKGKEEYERRRKNLKRQSERAKTPGIAKQEFDSLCENKDQFILSAAIAYATDNRKDMTKRVFDFVLSPFQGGDKEEEDRAVSMSSPTRNTRARTSYSTPTRAGGIESADSQDTLVKLMESASKERVARAEAFKLSQVASLEDARSRTAAENARIELGAALKKDADQAAIENDFARSFLSPARGAEGMASRRRGTVIAESPNVAGLKTEEESEDESEDDENIINENVEFDPHGKWYFSSQEDCDDAFKACIEYAKTLEEKDGVKLVARFIMGTMYDDPFNANGHITFKFDGMDESDPDLKAAILDALSFFGVTRRSMKNSKMDPKMHLKKLVDKYRSQLIKKDSIVHYVDTRRRCLIEAKIIGLTESACKDGGKTWGLSIIKDGHTEAIDTLYKYVQPISVQIDYKAKLSRGL